jgi:hypothetical protein
MDNGHAGARSALAPHAERSRRWSASSAFPISIAVSLLCLPQMIAAAAAVNTVKRLATVVPQQSVGRPVDVGPGREQPVVRVAALDVVLVDGSWGDKEVELTLRNETVKAVTAWSIQLDVLHPDGFIARAGISEDGYDEYEGLDHGTAPPIAIPAGGEIRVRVPLQRYLGHPEPVSSPTVTVVGVVFSDVSTAGDPLSLGQVSAGREQYYEGWAAVVAALESADSKTAGRDRAATAIAAMEKAETERFPKRTGPVDPTVRARLIVASARERLRSAIDGTAKVTPEEAVRNSLLEARRELMAVEHHRRPQS